MNDNKDASQDEVYHHQGQGNPVGHGRHDTETLSEDRVGAYWRANVSLMAKLLTVWFIVAFGFGTIFADALDQFQLFGFPLGFWFAQQGGIYVFVILIFIYVIRMGTIDRRFGVDDTDGPAGDRS